MVGHEVGAFFTFTDGTPLAALWRLALMTGMRRGELLGLKWQDIDLDKGTLSVRRTLSRGKGGTWELGAPKTAAGRRLETALGVAPADLMSPEPATEDGGEL